jgi:N-acetyl-gamma-glutamyl-phosphate reductase
MCTTEVPLATRTRQAELQMHKIFIDGQAGTTGLQIHQRLSPRSDIEILEIDPGMRKDPTEKQALIASADVVLLCLPDQAAREAYRLCQSPNVRFLDASTAHRIDPDWVYGLPELTLSQREAISNARLVSNPGCYSTGFLCAVVPLVETGLIDPSALITISGLSGYSGGGRQMIEKYENQAKNHPENLWHSRPYSLDLQHKHLPEMQKLAQLEHAPIFLPSVGHFHQGMLVTVALFQEHFKRPVDMADVHAVLMERYQHEPCITVHEPGSEADLDQGFLDPQLANGTNRLDLFIYGKDSQILLVARLDNLGKGAAGAAVQNLNLMLKVPELEGLVLEGNVLEGNVLNQHSPGQAG